MNKKATIKFIIQIRTHLRVEEGDCARIGTILGKLGWYGHSINNIYP
jgi:hypothetical protein